MFDFRKICLSDKDRIKSCLAVSDFRGCEYSFANNLAWCRLADTVIAFDGDFYISCSFYGGQPCFTFPSGVKTDEHGIERYIELFARLKKFVEDQNETFTVTSIGQNDLEWIKQAYDGQIEISADRAGFDYIYNSSDLIGLSGKKYHSKRNHIKRFKENDWCFRAMTSSDFDECIVFAADFYNRSDYSDHSAVVEQYAINTYFNNFETLGLKGGVLYCNGQLAGFTIGEQLNSDTFVVHIEKARADIQGAYPTLCNEFAKLCAADFQYINREEDLGIEGLRKSKLSYHPAFLQEKYTIKFNKSDK